MDVYCVRCGNLVPESEVGQIFRTGFFKITTPLALCGRCQLESAPKETPPERGIRYFSG